MNDLFYMWQALELAQKGEGFVEPNPMVGCVLVKDDQIIGQGYHTRYGQPHAEVEAIRSVLTNRSPADLIDSVCYVTLEPCSHYGKTHPCVDAILQAGIRRVVVAMRDPNPQVNGRGIQILRDAGIAVTEHILEDEARRLNAPYLTLLEKNRPWIHAKWAMTLDGKLASKSGDSRWISCEESRKIVHQLRSRMDAILIGAGTARHDDPMLTVRLDQEERVGNKVPYRVVLDASGTLSLKSQLLQTARNVPVLIITETSDATLVRQWESSGCEVLYLHRQESFIPQLLAHFAERKWTHVLIEGGQKVFGTFFDAQCIDDIHAFIAPKLIGSDSAIPVIGGEGKAEMSHAVRLEPTKTSLVGEDIYVRGRINWSIHDQSANKFF